MKAILLSFWILLTCVAHSNCAENYIIVNSQTFSLEIFNSNHDLIKTYPVGLGLKGMEKTKSGDKKTPSGEYIILWKASRFWETDGGYPIVEGAAFCGPNNIFTTDPNIGYSDEQLWTDAYGGDQAVVMCLNYPNPSDVAKGYTGDCIEIHATLLGGIGEFCSAGCIRMNPKDARELYHYVETRTKVHLH
jgi:lipoprotein-anchoring transpeptidase ErfK/SrfK